jgi:phage terminase large subunit GpA-like protein
MKLQPSMRSISIVADQFPQRPRDTSDAILFKERKDGLANLLITGANSPASLSQITVNYQVQNDLSKFEPNAAGDPEAQADNRSRAIEFAKIFKLSTPLVLPGCKITRDFEAGSQEMPFVPCPHCSHKQVRVEVFKHRGPQGEVWGGATNENAPWSIDATTPTARMLARVRYMVAGKVGEAILDPKGCPVHHRWTRSCCRK